MKKPLLGMLVLVISISLIVVFNSGGCRSSVTLEEEPEPNIALEIVELAKSQIGKLTGDGPFASLVWADSEITYVTALFPQ